MIPVNSINLSGNELKYVKDCIDSGWISSEGKYVHQFETQMAEYVGRRYSVAVSNGTAALEIAIKALDLPEKSEIIVPDATIVSCIGAILKCGHIPVLVDLNENWNMSIHSVKKSITKKTRAILGVNLYGYFPNWDELILLANQYDLILVEDAAQTIGGIYRGTKSGSIGAISTTSFYPNKQITTGEGGMLFTDDFSLYEKFLSYRNLCFGEGDERFKCKDLGWNYRLSNIQAAIGLAQLEQIDITINKKKELGEFYQNELIHIKEKDWILPAKSNGNTTNIYWVFGLEAPNEVEAKRIKEILNKNKIGWRPFYYPFSNMNIGKFTTYSSLKKGKILSSNAFYIPCGRNTSIQEAEIVASILVKNI